MKEQTIRTVWPQLFVKHVLVDIDGTIVYEDCNYPDNFGVSVNYFLGILRDLMVKKHHLKPEAALTKILDCESKFPEEYPYPRYLGIPERKVWTEIAKWQNKHLFVYPDAARMIKRLYETGFTLYLASSNGKKAALSKLCRAGLSNLKRTKYFKDMFGGDVIRCGKTGPEYFASILAKTGFLPEDMVMIGDDAEMDLKNAKKAGIEKVIIVWRAQPEEVVLKENGGIYVRTLDVVPKLLFGTEPSR
ncbi:MAG: HAD-IA family hydrolase [Candidatus Omnitrophota bacterium]